MTIGPKALRFARIIRVCRPPALVRGPRAAVAQSLNGSYDLVEVMCGSVRDTRQPPLEPVRDSGNADSKSRGGTEMPIVLDNAVLHMIWPPKSGKIAP